ncbi:DUF6541 family protein [Actinokineospora iranica]|uniref:Uncharacterized protein n=1 Tax=Actinokineospora iranica TaxID=1271860 RepID=A0A1G6P5W1_9PSEU|nr:DUF6541 family protein [Actinokineospora iranica]SDC75479.1 hypothetical protein SAMN05216174_104132 [Actinokineospora iranica]
MTWFEAIPVALVCTLWLLLPGLAVTYPLGLRGVAAWGVAPAITTGATAVTAVVADVVGMSWSPLLPVAVCAAMGVAFGVGALVLRRRFRVARTPDPRPVTLAAVLGLLPALALGAVTVFRGFGRPDNLSQTYDAMFHMNAIAFILDSGNGSSLNLAELGARTNGGSGFYPAAWHDLGSLVVMSTGASIPAAANLLSAAIAIVVWPLSCLVLARQVFGPSRAALAVTGVLSIGFGAFPWGLLGFGVLWPNALGLALVPAALALAVSITGLAKDDALGRIRSLVLLPVVGLAIGLANPGAAFSLIVLAVFPLLASVIRRSWRLHKAGRSARGAAELVAVVAVLGGVWYWTATTSNPLFANTRTTYWAPFDTPSRAVGEILLNATNGRPALWFISAVVLVGVVACLRSVPLRWVVAGHAATGFLYLVAASFNRPDTQKFTGYWYNDSYRLAAMLPITGVVLGTAGVLFLAEKIASRVAAEDWSRPRLGLSNTTTAAVVVVALLALGSRGMYLPDRTARIAGSYQNLPETATLADAEQREFFARVKDQIPEDAVVANNPWDGSGLLWALADRQTLYPHFTMPSPTEEQTYLAQHLDDVATDPKVCPAARALGVTHLLIGESEFWPWDPRNANYPGFEDPAGKPGFELVASDGEAKLYRITACATP